MELTRDVNIALRSPDRFYIGGEWVEPSTKEMFEVIQPATEEIFLRVAMAGADDMDAAVAAARVAFDEGPWPRMSPAERGQYLAALAQGLRDRASDIALGHTSEVGVLHSFAKYGGPGAGNTYDYYAKLAGEFSFIEQHAPSAGAEVALLVREPVGVVAAIIPWNAPVSAAAFKVAPALLAGCTVVLKSSPEAPSAMYVLAEIAEQIGLPAGVLNCVTADREVSERLVTDPRVDKVAFTGSVAAGRRIASLCGDRIARYTLELGGKSPGVILDDYDLEAAAASLSISSRRMSGQTCASLTRIIVSRHRHDEFVELLGDKLSKIRVGDPFDPATEMGPLAMRRQRDRVEHYISKGLEEGARLVTGGGRPAHLPRGFYIEPTVFADVDNSSTIAREEIFGPVLSVIPADNEEHAIQIANDTPFGLNAVVFTSDADRALAVARRFRAGTVGHNAAIYNFEVGFGGFKQSGVGREGGRAGLLPYLESKTVLLAAEPTSIDY
ncbi:aldehyde dehydrogenase [Frankia gtarii]|uniref:aldehyde dehydrogenase n=1 Tax=Frankia gtarii TaxID=2950102 RepID=UPI0021BEF5AF|nr:aldehyde dehydrogenase [Frankia gtarii]